MKSFLNTLRILPFLIALLLSSCGVEQKKETSVPGTEPDTPPILLEEAPTVLRRGNLRLLCLSESDLVLEELVSRFDQSHSEQIELITPPSEPSIDTEAYYDMAFSGDYDLISGDYPLLRMLAEADLLSPLDSLVESRLEEGGYLTSILNAGRVEDSLYLLAPFHSARGIRVPASLPAKNTQSIGDIAAYVATLSPEERLGLGREAEYLLYGLQGVTLPSGSTAMYFSFDDPALEALLALDELLATSYSDERPTGPISFYADPVSEMENRSWSPEMDYRPFPLGNENGFSIYSPQLFAVSKKSQVLGSVKDFLSLLLSEEIQRMELTATPGSLYKVHLALPIHQGALEEVLSKRAKDAMGSDWEHLDAYVSSCMKVSRGADHFDTYSLLNVYPALYQARSLPLEERSAFLEQELRAEIEEWKNRIEDATP